MEDYGSDFESDDSVAVSDDNHKSSQTVERSGEYHSEDSGGEEYSDDSEQHSNRVRDAPSVGPSSDVTVSSGTAGASGGFSAGDSVAHHPALRPTRRRLQAYLLKARRAYSRGQGARAVAQFVRALALARLVHGDRHWRTLRCQVLLARAYLDLQDLPVQADEHASEVLTTLLMYQGTELVPDGKRQVLYVQLVARLVRGQALVQLQRPAAAEECLQQAADLLDTYSRLRRRPADARPLLLRLHTALGRAGAARGRLEPARHRLTAALQLLPADSDRHRPDRVQLLRELAQLELRGARRQNALQAVQWLQQAAQLSSQCWGEDSAEHLESELAVCRAQGRLADCDAAAQAAALSSLHQRCVSRLGAAHTVTIRTADQLIQVHTEQEYFEKAVRECRDNTRAKIQLYGELSHQVVDSLRPLSQLYVSSGQLDRAVEVSRRCWAMEALMYGRNDRRVQASQAALAELERRLDGGGRGRAGCRSSTSTATPSIDDTLRL